MKTYNKIKTLWRRSTERPCNMIVGEFATPEFEFLQDVEWVATEKVDGTNIRIMWDGNKVRFGGKTDNAQIPAVLYNKLMDMFGGEANEQLFEQVFDGESVCLYGEGYGGKVQKGSGTYGDPDFVLFDIRIGHFWLKREDLEDIAKKVGIRVVPIVLAGTLQEISDYVEKGFFSIWGKFKSEGIIAKPKVDLLCRSGERIITKLKHKDFLKI